MTEKVAIVIIETEKSPNGDYIPCIVKEGESGYFLTDWTWGNDLAVARKLADDYNTRLKLTSEEVWTLVLKSMRLSKTSTAFDMKDPLDLCGKGVPLYDVSSTVTFYKRIRADTKEQAADYFNETGAEAKYGKMTVEEVHETVLKLGKTMTTIPIDKKLSDVMPPIKLICGNCGESISEDLVEGDIEEGERGEDRVTYECPFCKKETTSCRYG